MDVGVEDAATYLRIVITIGVFLATAVFAVQAVVVFRDLSRGQQMFTVAFIAFMAYVIDANRAALAAGLTWNVRLAFVSVGLVSLTAYLMEPWRIKRKRIGRPGVLSPPDDEN